MASPFSAPAFPPSPVSVFLRPSNHVNHNVRFASFPIASMHIPAESPVRNRKGEHAITPTETPLAEAATSIPAAVNRPSARE